GLAELPAAARRRQRVEDDVDGERHDRDLPLAVALREVDHRQRRDDAVVDLELLADRRIELVGDERARDVPDELAVPGQQRERASSEALVRDRISAGDSEAALSVRREVS